MRMTSNYLGPRRTFQTAGGLFAEGLGREEASPVGVFLGCKHTREDITMAEGCKATLFKYEMADFIRSCATKYL